MEPEQGGLRALVDRLGAAAARRLGLEPAGEAARTRAIQLRDLATGHLAVRAASLDAPLVVLLLGPTGAGKSSLFNGMAGRPASRTGVLRPTTRNAVLLGSASDVATVRDGALAGVAADRLEEVADPERPSGLVIIDAPDVDSVEHANRELADRLVEAADLCIFVTTATRYADRVPWTVLERVRGRGLPIVVVVNRLPPSEADRQIVVDDVRRLFEDAGFGQGLDVTGIAEGAIDPPSEALQAPAIEPIRARIDGLRADADARGRLAAEALAGSLAGAGPLVSRVADDVAHERIDVAALARGLELIYGRELGNLREEVHAGTFLRNEAIRHWQRYVGADDITRLFSRGIGAVRGALAAVFRPTAAPVAEVREATTDDLIGVARVHAAEAARSLATSWADDPRVGPAVGDRPDLWDASPDFDGRLRERLEAWIAGISDDIARTGERKRALAKGASIGVNVLGTGVMLATFIHTAGLTGAEVGVAAATAFLNQKLLGALFGEAAMVELIQRARSRLDAALDETFEDEARRFRDVVPAGAALEDVEAELRGLAAELVSAAGSGAPRAAATAAPSPTGLAP